MSARVVVGALDVRCRGHARAIAIGPASTDARCGVGARTLVSLASDADRSWCLPSSPANSNSCVSLSKKVMLWVRADSAHRVLAAITHRRGEGRGRCPGLDTENDPGTTPEIAKCIVGSLVYGNGFWQCPRSLSS